MRLGDVLREKRKALGMTQEQVATYVGVTAPAVNKWERGASCPDITLLPVLARLLKTDPNTLLCFQEELTEREIGCFLNDVVQLQRKSGYAAAFDMAMDKLHEYPHCARLRHDAAMVLDAGLSMAGLSGADQAALIEADTAAYRKQIEAMLEQVAQCEDLILSSSARFVLASKRLQQGDDARAQELLDQMPGKGIPDKRTLQADLLQRQGQTEAAVTVLQGIALDGLQAVLMAVTKLIPILVADGRSTQAEQLASAAQTEQEAYGMWPYSAYLAPMQYAVAMADPHASLRYISAMVDAAQTPWDTADCPLLCHQPKAAASDSFGQAIFPALLKELQESPAYAFLRDQPGFAELCERLKR